MSEKETHVGADVIIGNPQRMPTDDVLKADAGSLCSQYLHFWKKGEVEITVILSRPKSKRIIYATSVMERERLRMCLDSVDRESQIQSVLVSSHKVIK